MQQQQFNYKSYETHLEAGSVTANFLKVSLETCFIDI